MQTVFRIPYMVLGEFVEGVPKCGLELAEEGTYELNGSCTNEVYS